MTNFSTEDRQAICDTFERLLADKAHEEALRALMVTDAGFDRALWQEMAALGLTGVMVLPEYNGIGGSIEESEALMEVAGAFLYSGPYLSTCVLAPVLLGAAMNTDFSGPHLTNIVSGRSIFAVAGCGISGDWTQAPDVVAAKRGSDYILNGTAHYVQNARNADQIIVAAMDGDGLAVFCLPVDSTGLEIQTRDTDDKTSRLSSLTFKDTKAEMLQGVGRKEWHAALGAALVALAGEQAGATRRIFDMTIDYLNTRYQFGQPIGRFQALKHMAAELLIEVESASTVARHAARAIAAKAPHAPVLTYLAAFTCADNFRKVTAEAIQLHGGIAYTIEHPAHLYWRRAQTGQWLFGSSDRFRDLYLSAMEATL